MRENKSLNTLHNLKFEQRIYNLCFLIPSSEFYYRDDWRSFFQILKLKFSKMDHG